MWSEYEEQSKRQDSLYPVCTQFVPNVAESSKHSEENSYCLCELLLVPSLDCENEEKVQSLSFHFRLRERVVSCGGMTQAVRYYLWPKDWLPVASTMLRCYDFRRIPMILTPLPMIRFR